MANLHKKEKQEFDDLFTYKTKKVSKTANPLIKKIPLIEIREFLYSLGESPLQLSDKNCKKIKKLFPLPVEQNIIWADCEFDLRCSGIVCTDKGCFIKTNVGALDEKRKSKQMENGGKSSLYYFKWDIFSPAVFCEDDDTNYVLKVDAKCQNRFLSVCNTMKILWKTRESVLQQFEMRDFEDYQSVVVGAGQGVSLSPDENLHFIDGHIRNITGRHGFFAEQANNITDLFKGLKAKVIGGDNAKNGADRLVQHFKGNTYIQTKYYQTAEGSLKAGFGRDGLYKYIDDTGRPMQLEVPKEQYRSVVEGFKDKIRAGKVKGITNPNEANKIVRQGSITYEQAVQLAKAGTIDSIKFDIKTGIVSCSCAFGISCVATMFFSFLQHKDWNKAIQDGLKTGVKVFGLTMFNHVLLSQLHRTQAFQNFTGNALLRDWAITSGVTLFIYSIPKIYNVLSNHISLEQFLKDTVVLGASMVGGAIMATGLGIVGEKVGGTIGKFVGGIVGGILGGVGVEKAVKSAIDIVKEDDIQIFARFLSAEISSMSVEFMLNVKEINALSDKLKDINPQEIKNLMSEYRNSTQQEKVVRKFLTPYFEKIVKKRKKFIEPKIEDLCNGCLSFA